MVTTSSDLLSVSASGLEPDSSSEVPSPNGADVSTGHSVNGVPVTLARSVWVLVTPLSVPVTSTLSPGLSTLVSQSAGYLRSTTSPSPTMVESSSLMSLVRNTAPCFVSGSVLLVFVMVNTISVSPETVKASFELSRSPFGQPDLRSHFWTSMLGVMSGVRVHTTLDSRSLPL